MTMPALLLREDIAWREVTDGCLEARFPPSIPTHNEVQRFHFGPDGLLRQHDYTPDVVATFAPVAHVVLEHARWQGVPYTSKRRVTPRKGDGTPRSAPLLVGIEIHEWRLV
jgi:hypothetical protein